MKMEGYAQINDSITQLRDLTNIRIRSIYLDRIVELWNSFEFYFIAGNLISHRPIQFFPIK